MIPLRSNFLSVEDFRDDVSGRMLKPELFRREADLSRCAIVAGVHDRDGGRVIAFEGRHDRTNEDIDFAVLVDRGLIEN